MIPSALGAAQGRSRPAGPSARPCGTFSRTMGRLGYAGKLLGHVVRFAAANKVYWIVPLLLVLALLAIVIFVGQASAPFIYTLW